MCKMKLRGVAFVLFLLVLIQGGVGQIASTHHAEGSTDSSTKGTQATERAPQNPSASTGSPQVAHETPTNTINSAQNANQKHTKATNYQSFTAPIEEKDQVQMNNTTTSRQEQSSTTTQNAYPSPSDVETSVSDLTSITGAHSSQETTPQIQSTTQASTTAYGATQNTALSSVYKTTTIAFETKPDPFSTALIEENGQLKMNYITTFTTPNASPSQRTTSGNDSKSPKTDAPTVTRRVERSLADTISTTVASSTYNYSKDTATPQPQSGKSSSKEDSTRTTKHIMTTTEVGQTASEDPTDLPNGTTYTSTERPIDEDTTTSTEENDASCNSDSYFNLTVEENVWDITLKWNELCRKNMTITMTSPCNTENLVTNVENVSSYIFDKDLKYDCNYVFNVNNAVSRTVMLKRTDASLNVSNLLSKNCERKLSWTTNQDIASANILVITSKNKTNNTLENVTSETALLRYRNLPRGKYLKIQVYLRNNKSVEILGGQLNNYEAKGISAVRSLMFDNKTNFLTWNIPEIECETIKAYRVKISSNSRLITLITTKEGEQKFRVTQDVIESGLNATAVVTAIDAGDVEGEPAEYEFYKVDDIPPVPSAEAEGNVTGSVDTKNPSQQVVVNWPPNLFGSNYKDIRWEVLLQRDSVVEDSKGRSGYISETTKPLTWSQFIGGRKGFYRPTKSDWKPSLENGVYTLVVGSEQCKQDGDDYCNGPLDPQTKYKYIIRGFSTIGYRDSEPKTISTEVSKGIANQIVISLIFLAILGTIMFGLYYTRRNQPRCMQKVLVYLRPLGSPNREPMMEMHERRPLVSKAIPKDEFSKYLEELLNIDENDETNELSEQFKQLALLSPPPPSTHPENYAAAMIQYNKHKNRYINILPYDSTRVKLQQISPNDPESDYINASYVKGFSGDVEYIACQGPRADTAEDFWRMVFEKDVCVIAMVTHLQEKGKEKCHKYFPDMRETIRYELIAVKCILQADFPVFTRRTFLVQETNGVLLKTVIHLHFKEWPDFGCPETTDLLLSYTRTVREVANDLKGGLVLVHCSAGVGRTGTLIALDILLQQIRVSSSFNIFDTILQLRYHRINMVQTETQYKFIHECVRDAIEEEKKNGQWFTIPNGGANKLDPIYQNLNKEKSVSVVTEINEIEDMEDNEMENSAEENFDEAKLDLPNQNLVVRPPSIRIEINEFKDEKDQKNEISVQKNLSAENLDSVSTDMSLGKSSSGPKDINDLKNEDGLKPIDPVLHLADDTAIAVSENLETTEEIVPLVDQTEILEVTRL